MMGNAITDYYEQMNTADFAYQLGLIDYQVYESMKAKENSAIQSWNADRTSSIMVKWQLS